MSKQRTHYEPAFKLEIARMVVDQGMSVAQVVKDMNIGRTAVTRWVEQFRAEQQSVGARIKMTTCAGLKLTRCYSGVDYYAAVDKSTRL